MALNLSRLDKARALELNRIESRISEQIAGILEKANEHHEIIAARLACAFYDWRAKTNDGATTLRYTLTRDWPRDFAKPAIEDAKEIRSACHRIGDMDNSFALSVRDRLKSRGFEVDHLNEMLSAVADEMRSIEEQATEIYDDWVELHGGNKCTPIAYLRLAFDDCLQDYIQARYRRARIIAASEVAVEKIDAGCIAKEINRVNSFLEKNGR